MTKTVTVIVKMLNAVQKTRVHAVLRNAAAKYRALNLQTIGQQGQI